MTMMSIFIFIWVPYSISKVLVIFNENAFMAQEQVKSAVCVCLQQQSDDSKFIDYLNMLYSNDCNVPWQKYLYIMYKCALESDKFSVSMSKLN